MDILPQQAPRIDYPATDPEKPYVYPGTRTLINHFGIGDVAVLQRVVDTVAGLRGDQLKPGALAGDPDLGHLCAIHRALFQDIFAWAGQVRIVDTEKQGQNFVPAAEIPDRFRRVVDGMKTENFLRGLEAEDFATRLAHYWYEVYAVHVFRDGNSRTMRYFFAGIAAAAGYRLDCAAIEPMALLTACRKRYFNGEMDTLRSCLRQTISAV